MITAVYVTKCQEYDKRKVKKAILAAFSDLKIDLSEAKKKSKILIKPNLLAQKRPEDNVTTHPAILDAVLDILVNDFKEKEFRIIIGESSGTSENNGTEKAFEMSGLKTVADRYKIIFKSFEKSDKVRIETKDLKEEYYLKELTFPKDLLEADIIINLPKMKTHVLMDYTGAVKNFFGVISGNQKMMYHIQAPDKEKFSKVLADIYQLIISQDKKMMNIMDGIIGMEGNGPANGTAKRAELILVSEDAVALDVVATNIMGYETIKLAFIKELFSRKINPFPVEQRGIPKIKINFKKPVDVADKIPNFLKRYVIKLLMKDPEINQEKCKRCLVCYNHCPAKTIHVYDLKDTKKDDKKLSDNQKQYKKYVEIDLKKCIHCFCCHELCPHDAIELRRRRPFNIFNIIKNKKKR